jgi:hypothetical protein
MSRNLIASKAWESGRDKVCKECEYFGCEIENTTDYDWDKCQKLQNGVEYLQMWNGESCSFFTLRKN